MTHGGPKDHRWPTLQQLPGPGSPPDWLAHPEDYQAPQAASNYQASPPTTDYQAPESFVQQPAPPVEPQPQTGDGGFSFSWGNKKITGWRAALAIALGLAAFTLLQVWQYTSTTAAVNAFDQAPYCSGNKVQAGCKTSWLMWLSIDTSNNHCWIRAHPTSIGYPYYSGAFNTDVCSSLSNGSHALVTIWQGSLVHLTRLSREDWATDSAVAEHTAALQMILIMLLVDAGYALIVTLYLASWIVRGRRTAA